VDIESEAKEINAFVAKGNYHAAINIAISNMNECRRESDQAGVDYFLDMIKAIANTMADEFGS
jgi:hypothetical protein